MSPEMLAREIGRGRHCWSYVYHLVDGETGTVFYVGMGHGTRMAAHEAEAAHGEPGAKCERIRRIWDRGHRVERRIVAMFRDRRAALRHELATIHDIGYENLTNGGAVEMYGPRMKKMWASRLTASGARRRPAWLR